MGRLNGAARGGGLRRCGSARLVLGASTELRDRGRSRFPSAGLGAREVYRCTSSLALHRYRWVKRCRCTADAFPLNVCIALLRGLRFCSAVVLGASVELRDGALLAVSAAGRCQEGGALLHEFASAASERTVQALPICC